ncbi:Y-family DNA polymerase [Ralstonia mannitolilytica]|uniref:Y-family DNA polymerase n=1 Tax=Ralstonia mannitolilytica TaxID=105219 RepID=UPI001C978611|nr:DNA polymerase Y family protein [Ralstonia mannitolilytica]MBY4719749.1 DNA polymerase Y family protein [Ralstonia mannitolilytica]
MPFWIAVHLPRLPLDALRPRWSDPAALPLPVMVLEQERVVSANRLAMREGIRPGLRRAGAQALVPHAVQLERDPAAEARLLQSLALALLAFTPHVTLDVADESTVLLEVEASLRLFGGHRALCRAVKYCAFRLGAMPQLGTGPTARGAAWLASTRPASVRGRRRMAMRSGWARRAVRLERMSALLDRLSVDAVARLTRPDWLEGLGCRTLADLRDLPRSGLRRRCGPRLVDALDAAYGTGHESFTWFAAPLRFDVPLELPGRIDSAEGVLAASEQLLLQLVGWLSAHQLGAKTYRLTLEHERRRGRDSADADASTPIEIALAQPVRTLAHLSRVLHERVHRLTLIAPVVELRLTVTDATPLAPPTASLFPEPGGRAEDAARLIDTLIARLGAGNVRHPQPCADHRPERANHWVEVNAATTAQSRAAARQALAQWHAQQPERPLWLLETPIPLLTRKHYPYYRGRLRLVSMPERIESGWWDDGLIKRDYFIAEGEGGVRYWLYRERVSAAQTSEEDARWYLHGLFG